VSSFGTGAVVVPFINRRAGPAAAVPATSTAAPPSGTPAEPTVTPQATPTVAPEAQVVEMDLDEPIDYRTAQEVNLEQEQAREDDFTVISGIGPTFQRRLKAAGIRTYADLAALTPEQVAEIIGWPVERVIRTGLIEQAARLAQQG
jgi:NADH-quinone oxidoreductase subunit E